MQLLATSTPKTTKNSREIHKARRRNEIGTRTLLAQAGSSPAATNAESTAYDYLLDLRRGLSNEGDAIARPKMNRQGQLPVFVCSSHVPRAQSVEELVDQINSKRHGSRMDWDGREKEPQPGEENVPKDNYRTQTTFERKGLNRSLPAHREAMKMLRTWTWALAKRYVIPDERCPPCSEVVPQMPATL